MTINKFDLQIPRRLETNRLLIRAPQMRDAVEINAAIHESHADLKPWMPWAQTKPTLDQSIDVLKNGMANWDNRDDFHLLVFLKADPKVLIGSSGLHRPDWKIPSFEIGYWMRTRFQGYGYISEAVLGITDFAFQHLKANRVHIRVDENNERSWRVPERIGYEYEGTLRNDTRSVDGKLRSTRIYARIRPFNRWVLEDKA